MLTITEEAALIALTSYGDVMRMITPREIYKLEEAEKLIEKLEKHST